MPRSEMRREEIEEFILAHEWLHHLLTIRIREAIRQDEEWLAAFQLRSRLVTVH